MAEPRDLFAPLRGLTQARIGLGRAGQGLPTAPALDFRMAHAMARDAVHTPLDLDALKSALAGPVVNLTSAAPDRAAYLQNPDLGRTLAPDTALPAGPFDLVIVLGDGLCASGVQAHGPALVSELIGRLEGWTVAPLVIATQARVALGDAIGAAMNAQCVLMLIGERPGLSSPDSVGAYLTWAPRPGTADSDRNCVSNIRPAGLAPVQAADKIAWLLTEARRLGLTGIGLKDRHGGAVISAPADQPVLPSD